MTSQLQTPVSPEGEEQTAKEEGKLSPNSCLKCVFLITNSSALGALGHTNQGLSNRGLNLHWLGSE